MKLNYNISFPDLYQKNVNITISQRILLAICCIFVNILDILAIFVVFFSFFGYFVDFGRNYPNSS
jgi:hypothetical protein